MASGRINRRLPLEARAQAPCCMEGGMVSMPKQVEGGDSHGGDYWMLVSFCSRRKVPSPPQEVQDLKK